MKIKEFGPQMRTMLKQWRARAKDEIPEQDLEKAYMMGFEQGEQGNYTPAKDREFMRWMKNDYPNKMTLLMSIWKEGNDISYSKFLMDSLPEEQEVKGMRKELVVEIQEEVSIPQDNKTFILEKGDKIKVLKKLEEDDNLIYMTLVGMQGKNIGCTMFLKSLNMNITFTVKRATVEWDREDNRIYVMGTNSPESFVISPSKVKVSAGGSSSINLTFIDGSGNMTLSKA